MDWLGYTPNDHPWEPIENLHNDSNLVAEFRRQYSDKPSLTSCIMTRGTLRQRRGMLEPYIGSSIPD